MTRLMSSHDPTEVEELKSRLFRAGIRSEIRGNPVANALGITRLEVHIFESDFIDASRIQQEFLASRNNGSELNVPQKSGTKTASSPQVAVASRPEPPRPRRLNPAAPAAGELAEAAGLLEKEVEEVLARDRELTERCATLQAQAKAVNESLVQVQAELSRQSSNRVAAEQKLAQAIAARGSLEKELESVNLRLKAAEQSLAAANGQLEARNRELKQQQVKVGDLNNEVASRDRQLGDLVETVAQTRAALENEKGLRLSAEQKASEHAAVRKSLEQQVNEFSELQTQSQHDREQIQNYIDTVNKLRGRLNQKRS